MTPVFEAPKLNSLLRLPGPLLMWEEDEDPFALIAHHAAGCAGRGVALDPATRWFAAGLMAALEGAVQPAQDMIATLRQVKSPAEIAIIQTAMDADWQVQRAVQAGLRPGIGTTEVAGFINAAHGRLG